IRDARADLFFGESEVLVPARALLGMPGVSLAPGHRVHYHHLLLPEHAILDCAGLPAESFLPNAYGLSLLSESARASLEATMPPEARAHYRPARPILRNFEAQTLRAA
ncbi:MAG: Hint domain-containing protein, partial [Pseudomonadota bacterium]